MSRPPALIAKIPNYSPGIGYLNIQSGNYSAAIEAYERGD